MKYKIKAADPDEIELELTIKMSLSEWKRLRKQIDSIGYPGNTLDTRIWEMIKFAEKHFESEQEEE